MDAKSTAAALWLVDWGQNLKRRGMMIKKL